MRGPLSLWLAAVGLMAAFAWRSCTGPAAHADAPPRVYVGGGGRPMYILPE